MKNEIGFDGYWTDGTHSLLIEVKTTDAYRINLDVITTYAAKLQKQENIDADDISTLIVVGRQDTGDLEAQVRGSRHAWAVRIISVDALSKLVFINEQFNSSQMLSKIRKILLPFEYTRVDDIVDLVFETQQETEVKLSADDDVEEASKAETTQTDPEKAQAEKTPKELIALKRSAIAASFFGLRSKSYTQKSKTGFSSADGEINIVCSISKRYLRDYQPYWYALHPDWLETIRQSKEGYLILGCADSNIAYALPRSFLEENLNNLNMTEKDNGKSYWHIALNKEDEIMKINMSKIGKKVELTPFVLNF